MKIIRFKENEIGTWGELLWDNFRCYTFEPAGPDTIERGQDRRIPQGLYRMRWHDSARYNKKMPHIYNDKVPANRYILIHNGNLPEHTEGCILLGTMLDSKGIFNSKIIFNEFRDRLISRSGGKFTNDDTIPFELEIINKFGD